MAGLDSGLTVPVWLAEDDLGCIICHGLLSWPVTLPCGHSFCRACLKRMWGAGPSWSCPTCREGSAQPLQLRKNTLLQDLASKYSRAVGEGEGAAGQTPSPAPGPAPQSPGRAAPQSQSVEAPRNITEVGQELAKLTEQLVDIVRSLQSQTQLPDSGPDNKLNTPGTADHSLASPKLVTSSTSGKKMRDILHDLEDIRGKLQESFLGKELRDEQRQAAEQFDGPVTMVSFGPVSAHRELHGNHILCGTSQVKILESPSSSSCPLTDRSRLASWLVQRSISPTFDLRSLSCSLKVSEDCRKVTVSHFPQSYSWSRDRFTTCQVFCSQAFSSGQHYWEVDTQHCSHWAVGVASWKMSRDQTLGRTRDSSCLEWKGTSQLSVWHMVKETVLGSEKPKVVGIYLDLDRGKLAFYSVAEQEKLLWECSVSASSSLHPAFWLYGLYPGNSLTIRPVRI